MTDAEDKPRVAITVGGDNTGNILVDNTIHINQMRGAGLEITADPQLNERKLRLFRVAAAGYNVEELAALAFELGIDPEDVAGQTKSARARELVEYAARHSRLDALEAALRRQRPALFDE